MAFVVIKNIKPDPVRAGFFGAVEKYFVFLDGWNRRKSDLIFYIFRYKIYMCSIYSNQSVSDNQA